MIRKRFDRSFDKSGKFWTLLGNKNFYHVLLSIIISMSVEVRSELGGVASESTIFFALGIFAGYKYYLFRPLELVNKALSSAFSKFKSLVSYTDRKRLATVTKKV
jgi:hypothetical protein